MNFTTSSFIVLVYHYSSELQEAIGRINKSVLKGRTLKAVVSIVKKESVSSEDTSNLLLQNLPDNVNEEYLKVVLSTTMGVGDAEFSVKCLGSAAALLTFTKCLPKGGKSTLRINGAFSKNVPQLLSS